jgi:hypothetical protein
MTDSSVQFELQSPLATRNSMDNTVINITHQKLQELLSNLQDNTPQTGTDSALTALRWKDFPAMRRALQQLKIKSKDMKLDIFFRARITAMVGSLNLYLDSYMHYTWRQATLIVAKSQGAGPKYARNLRTWLLRYISCGDLPLHHYGGSYSPILHDEDFTHDLKLHLLEISDKGYVRAQDVVDYVALPEIQEKLGGPGGRTKISLRTGQRWLKKLDWRYGKKKKGMYIDGHEREDVIKYREEFTQRWKEYEKRMVTYNNDGTIQSTPKGFAVPQGARFRLILVTHDESTFYQEDRRKSKWTHKNDKATPERKGEGSSIMISDFLTPDWGRLKDDDEYVAILSCLP